MSEDGCHLQADDAEQAVIRAARQLREAGLSLRKVGAELEAEGLLSRCGRKWNPKTVRDVLRADLAESE